MSNTAKLLMRSLGWEDADALLTFYNGLSPASIRTFRPLGDQTSLPVCQAIVADEDLVIEMPKYTKNHASEGSH